MKTISMPDHSDFQKSRTALLSTSIVLFILSNMTLNSDIITILGLEIIVSKPEIVIFWRMVVGYFIYIYIGRSSIEYQDLLIQKSTKEADDLKNDGYLEHTNDPDVYMVTPLKLKKRDMQLRYKLYVDIAPAMVISFVSMGYSFFKI